MSEQETEELTEELKRKVTNPNEKVIHIKHEGLPAKQSSGDPSKEELKEKLELRETQLTAIALKQFDKDKEKLLSKIKDEKQREYVDETIGESPEMLESVKATMVLIGKGLEVGNASIEDEDLESVPPSGMVKLPPEDVKFASHTQVINGLYKILEDPKKTQAEKDEANRRINQFYDQFIAGRRKSLQEDPNQRFYFATSICPKCHKTVFLDRKKNLSTCPHCGAKATFRKE